MQQKAIMDAQYVNVEIPLPKEQTEWHEAAPGKYIRYEQFQGSDEEMDFIVDLFTKELTEPYSSFTYQYFVFGWPDLCITAYGVQSDKKPDASVKGEKVGAVVSRVTRKGPTKPLRGYLAMFAVVPSFRGFRLGSRLVTITVELMKAKGCDELYLETPVTNEKALNLYLRMGFTKTKFLERYYLDYSDAVRLKLWLKDAIPEEEKAAATA
ncbi:peptide alpha-N-acetyltransferase [Angomonas deanei]|nr:peptide alpha-N-acetyltransferase [Angomonas deanei]|eukprot:EPY35975.1 peptide alpha-N-acetyltransferase [Angomonas deanei]